MTAQPTRKAKAGTVKARVMWAVKPELAEMFVAATKPSMLNGLPGPLFVLTTRTANEARRIVKAVGFLKMSRERQEDVVCRALLKHFKEVPCMAYIDVVDAIMGVNRPSKCPTPSRLRAKPQGEKL